MKLRLIAAMGVPDRAIGRAGHIPWSIPDDLKRFKRLTAGHAVLMGRKTAESLGRALPRRLNLILSHQPDFKGFDNTIVLRSFSEALAVAATFTDDQDLFFIGGAEVYRYGLRICDTLHMTYVHQATPDADAHFPPWEGQWSETERQACIPEVGPRYDFVDYERLAPRPAVMP